MWRAIKIQQWFLSSPKWQPLPSLTTKSKCMLSPVSIMDVIYDLRYAYFLSLVSWAHWKTRQVSHCVWVSFRFKDKTITVSIIFVPGGDGFSWILSLVWVSLTFPEPQHKRSTYNNRWCSRLAYVFNVFHLVLIQKWVIDIRVLLEEPGPVSQWWA